MQEQIGTSAQSEHDFAGLLAALSAAKPIELPKWNEEGLQQDVATLCYEQALRTHARYRPDNIGAPQAFASQPVPESISTQADCRALRSPAKAPAAFAMERDRKCASITIRMSKAECEQLHRRAAEAGLTVSAYLRSCTFEAEALRAQVKQALAELRNAHAPETRVELKSETQPAGKKRESAQSPRLSWLRRIILDLHPARSLAGA